MQKECKETKKNSQILTKISGEFWLRFEDLKKCSENSKETKILGNFLENAEYILSKTGKIFK